MAKKKTYSINVLKPFRFTYPSRNGALPVERAFPVGVHEVDEYLATHPWIVRDHADGAVESPTAALARANREAAKAAEDQANAENAKAAAAASMARLTALHSANVHESKNDDLHKPLGSGVRSPTPTKIDMDDPLLNTPMNKLVAINAQEAQTQTAKADTKSRSTRK